MKRVVKCGISGVGWLITAIILAFLMGEGSAAASYIRPDYGTPVPADFQSNRVNQEIEKGSIDDRGPTQPASSREPLLGSRNIQTLTHIVGSHAGIVTQPVTAASRLFFLMLDTGVGMVNWTRRLDRGGDRERPPADNRGMDLDRWERDLDDLTGNSPSSGTISYLVDGGRYFPRLQKQLLAAKESVYIRTFIFDDDDFAAQVAGTLKTRSYDVDVRVLLDGLGTITATKDRKDSLPAGFKQPPSVRSDLTRDSKVRVRQQFNPWLTGDHTKTTIIDGSTAFIGGMNIGREYRYEWHDLMMEVEGPVVGRMQREFRKAWASAGLLGDLGKFLEGLKPRKKKSSDGGYPIRVLYTKPGQREIFLTQIEAIRRARKYIYIQNPYITDDTIVHELIRARRRGVDVRVIFPVKCNWDIMNVNNALTINRMLKMGIRVYRYPTMSHVKAAVYDGWACLGSANFDRLSLHVNYEMNLATSHPAAVRGLLDQLFIPDFERSFELTDPVPVKDHYFLLEIVADQL